MAKKTTSIKQKLIKTGAVVLTGATLIGGGIAIAKHKQSSKEPSKDNGKYNEKGEFETPSILDNVDFDTTTQNKPNLEPTLSYYGEEEYYMFSTEQILELGRQSIAECEAVLNQVDGLRHFGNDGNSIFPDYYDEYLIAGLAYTESTFRIYDEDKNLLKSHADAYGLTQVKKETIDYVNWWMENILELENPNYTLEDLKDPKKAMMITNYFNLSSILNYIRGAKPLYEAVGCTTQGQKEVMLAIYNAGAGNVTTYMDNGTLHRYLSSGSKSNYVNKVLANESQIRAQNEDNIEMD